jgi:protease II
VLQYLQAENTYAEAYFKPLQQLVNDIMHDMDMTNPDVEVSAPKVHNGYVYYNTRGPGQDYWDAYRRPLVHPVTQSAAAAPIDVTAAGGYENKPGSSLAAAVAGAMAAAQQETRPPGSSTGSQPGSSSGSNGGQPGSSGSSTEEKLVLDQNRLSRGHTYWDVVSHEVSPDGQLVAYLVDTVGDEDFALQVSSPQDRKGGRQGWNCVSSQRRCTLMSLCL